MGPGLHSDGARQPGSARWPAPAKGWGRLRVLSAAVTAGRVGTARVRLAGSRAMTLRKSALVELAGAATACLALGGGCAAHAASPGAWAAHESAVVAACSAASALRESKPGGSPIEFDDRLGLTALVIEGRYPQAHMKNQRGQVLCLYDKRTRSASVADTDALLRAR